jgi:gliding motility-associated-like protein
VVKVWTYVAPVAGFKTSFSGGTVPLGVEISFTDTSSGQVTDWAWSFDDGHTSMLPNPKHTYSSADFFTVTLMVSNNGCMDSTSKEAEVQVPPISITSFTPNNDGINDVIWIDGGLTSLYELTFFNRWGHQLWTGQGRAFGWDGKTSAGVDCEVGTYYYVLERKDQDTGSTSTQTGFVSLLR